MHGIDKNRFIVVFVCPDDSTLDALAIRIGMLGIKVYRYSLSGPNWKVILRLKTLFHKLKPQIIHFNDPTILGIIAARLAGISLLVITHHTPELDRKYNWKGRLLEKIIFKFFKPKIIFTSDYDKVTGIKKDTLSETDCFVVHYGLPPERFDQQFSREDVYREFSLSDDCRIIANVARLNPQKGQEYLIEAAPLIIKQFKSVKFFCWRRGIRSQAQDKSQGKRPK
ncbi:MAG: glycosyltransferase family 4 protein [Candidatus Omnitrophica bacterium]|nr:glycosyltransferase family 4 protein [Candidatus Omnitrophota bacterium]